MKPSVRNGFLYAGISILLMLVMYVTGWNRSENSWMFQLVSLVIPIAIIRMTVIDYQKTIGGGWVTFNQAFREGMIVMMVGTICVTIFSLIYNKYIDPDLMKFTMEKQANKLSESGMSDEMVQERMAYAIKFTQPGWMILFGILGGLFIGSILAIIMAAILKKPNPEEIS